jgi:hypothetical protein
MVGSLCVDGAGTRLHLWKLPTDLGRGGKHIRA